jgi:hypothetical protein
MHEVVKWNHQWACPNDSIVWVIVKRLDEAWRKDKGCYLPPGSCLNNRVGEWLVKLAAAKERLPMSLIGYYEEKIMFTDGRHRFGWCRDNGIRAMPVSVESSAQSRLVGKLFGSKFRVCRIPIQHQRELELVQLTTGESSCARRQCRAQPSSPRDPDGSSGR